MRRRTTLSGVGVIAFALLTAAPLFLANSPGGNYSLKDVTTFYSSGHRPAVIVSLYLGLLGSAILVATLASLGELGGDTPDHRGAHRVFWGCGVAAAASLAVGWGLNLVGPASRTLGGAAPISPKVAYVFAQAGLVTVFGAGCFLLGCALIALAVALAGSVPAWVRWTAVVAGLAGITSVGFFPFFVLIACLIVMGIGLVLVPTREAAPAAATS